MPTNKIKRNFAFRLSEDDFDSKGDKNDFESDECERGPEDNT